MHFNNKLFKQFRVGVLRKSIEGIVSEINRRIISKLIRRKRVFPLFRRSKINVNRSYREIIDWKKNSLKKLSLKYNTEEVKDTYIRRIFIWFDRRAFLMRGHERVDANKNSGEF